MANIKLNGQTNLNNVTCLSYTPTILEVSSNTSGSYTIYTLTFGTFSGLDTNTDFYVQINDTVLTKVGSVSEAKGYRFYMLNTSLDSSKKMMIDSLMASIKRIPEVAAGYEVYMPYNSSDGSKQLTINLKSISYGELTPLTITTNIPFLTISKSAGSASTELKEGYLKVDIMQNKTPYKYNSGSTASGSYVTTLSKHTANDSKVKFDLGSVFASLTEDGEATSFGLQIYQVTGTSLTEIAYYPSVYNVNGYLINQGGEFLPQFSNAKIALNAHRGETRNYYNNTILYVYENTIPLSFFVGSGVNTISYNINYIGSDNEAIISVPQSVAVANALSHATIYLSDTYLKQAKYIDIEFTAYNLGTIRFNVIKPIKATGEEQRIYWYNSWGGVSFMDFTGNRTEERKVSNTTYEDSILNYYDNDINEKDYIYDKTNEITVKLTTHNILKDAQWHLFDLQQSRNAWTYVNGEKYRIIIGDITINTTSVTDIYTATVQYTYSMGVNV